MLELVVVASLALVAQPGASLAFVAAQPTQIVDQELKNLIVVDSILLNLERRTWVDLFGAFSLLLFTLVALSPPGLLLSQTSILHSYMREQLLMDNDIQMLTLPNGEEWTLEGYLDDPSIYFSQLASGSSFTDLNITLKEGVDTPFLGAWYLEPIQATSKPAVLYLHGVSDTRVGYDKNRVGTYKVLLAAGHPVLTVDYRGFADSTDIPAITETTMVADAARALQYLRTELGHSSVLVWGHSHGAAVAAIMMAAEADTDSLKLVLESPYNNLQAVIDAIGEWYQRLLIALVGLDRVGLEFRTDEILPLVTCPVLILHSEDDLLIPAELSEKLFEDALNEKGDISRIVMDSSFAFTNAHSQIHTIEDLSSAKPLSKIVSKFWAGDIPNGLRATCTLENIDRVCDL